MPAFNPTTCCALREFFDIKDCGSPHNTLVEFCKLIKNYKGDIADPGAFILFSGIESITTTECTCSEAELETYGCECTSGRDAEEPVGYGSALAAYIKEHKLGTVVGSPAKFNTRNEPTHSDRVWVWAPDFENLKVWWAANRTAPRKRST